VELRVNVESSAHLHDRFRVFAALRELGASK